MYITDDWNDTLCGQLGNLYQQLHVNMQLQELAAEKYEETGEDKYCDIMQDIADNLPVTIGIGDQLITMPNVAPVFDAFISMLVDLAREYLVDLPETEADNDALRDLAQQELDKFFND